MPPAYGLCVRDRGACSMRAALRARIVTDKSIEHMFDIIGG